MEEKLIPGSAPDPALPMVCGRAVAGDPVYFPKAEFHGREIFFCTEFCLNAFRADPDRFYKVHNKQNHDPQNCEFKGEETR
jgi:YHS domain-containing protein